MNTGTLNERIDLINTLESGQTFLWERVGDGVYETVLDGEAIRVKEDGPVVRYETTGDVSEAEDTIKGALGLDCSLDAVHSSFPDDARLKKAVEGYGGMRVVSDPFFPCAVSFIISSQNRIPRIKKLVSDIRREYGEPVEFGDRTLYSFPDPSTLAQVPEDELRDLGLGYRAPYVVETSRMVADGEVDPDEIRSMDYHDAHNAVQELVGVGDKVADCVLLFSLDFHKAVPLDTWMETTVEEYYPGLAGKSYRETCDSFREYFGEYAGYAQNYLFHYIRKNEGDA